MNFKEMLINLIDDISMTAQEIMGNCVVHCTTSAEPDLTDYEYTTEAMESERISNEMR